MIFASYLRSLRGLVGPREVGRDESLVGSDSPTLYVYIQQCTTLGATDTIYDLLDCNRVIAVWIYFWNFSHYSNLSHSVSVICDRFSLEPLSLRILVTVKTDCFNHEIGQIIYFSSWRKKSSSWIIPIFLMKVSQFIWKKFLLFSLDRVREHESSVLGVGAISTWTESLLRFRLTLPFYFCSGEPSYISVV